MSPQAQRIAIAEVFGWKQTHIVQMGKKGKFVSTYRKGRGNLRQSLPDYLNDLNAMHEAEKVLMAEWKEKYLDVLSGFTEGRRNPDYVWHTTVFATAAQRAEAFLRTIGKWKEASK
jgi:hypothetical protein